MSYPKILILIGAAVLLAGVTWVGMLIYDNISYDHQVEDCHTELIEFLKDGGELAEGERIAECEDISEDDYTVILMSAVIEANPELDELAEWGETL